MAVNEKYLDHLQSVINRHNSNSFVIKGWTITLSTAILAIAGTWKEPLLSLIALVPIIVFWVLDSFYLANERCFVGLYNAAVNNYCLKVENKELRCKKREKSKDDKGLLYVDLKKEVEIKTKEYYMKFRDFRIIKRNNWYHVLKSRTIVWFYLMLSGFSIALFITLLNTNIPKAQEPLKVSVNLESDSLVVKSVNPQINTNNSVLKLDTTQNIK